MTSTSILGHPQLIECMRICVLILAHEYELRGSNVYLHISKTISGNFSLHSARVGALGRLLLEMFGIFLFKKMLWNLGANFIGCFSHCCVEGGNH